MLPNAGGSNGKISDSGRGFPLACFVDSCKDFKVFFDILLTVARGLRKFMILMTAARVSRFVFTFC